MYDESIFFTGVCFGVVIMTLIGVFFIKPSNRKEWEKEAVKAGVAEIIVDEYGQNRVFKFKQINHSSDETTEGNK